jgi:hypothetical protein
MRLRRRLAQIGLGGKDMVGESGAAMSGRRTLSSTRGWRVGYGVAGSAWGIDMGS